MNFVQLWRIEDRGFGLRQIFTAVDKLLHTILSEALSLQWNQTFHLSWSFRSTMDFLLDSEDASKRKRLSLVEGCRDQLPSDADSHLFPLFTSASSVLISFTAVLRTVLYSLLWFLLLHAFLSDLHVYCRPYTHSHKTETSSSLLSLKPSISYSALHLDLSNIPSLTTVAHVSNALLAFL